MPKHTVASPIQVQGGWWLVSSITLSFCNDLRDSECPVRLCEVKGRKSTDYTGPWCKISLLSSLRWWERPSGILNQNVSRSVVGLWSEQTRLQMSSRFCESCCVHSIQNGPFGPPCQGGDITYYAFSLSSIGSIISTQSVFYMHKYVLSFKMCFEISQQGASQRSFEDGEMNLSGPTEVLSSQRTRLPVR